jgi:hypothetical protein
MLIGRTREQKFKLFHSEVCIDFFFFQHIISFILFFKAKKSIYIRRTFNEFTWYDVKILQNE